MEFILIAPRASGGSMIFYGKSIDGEIIIWISIQDE